MRETERQRERERDRERETDRQTDRERDREICVYSHLGLTYENMYVQTLPEKKYKNQKGFNI